MAVSSTFRIGARSASGLRMLLLALGVGAVSMAALLIGGAGSPALPAAWATPSSSEITTDDRGFVDTAAYCQGDAVAVAYGRTTSALVTICGGPDGQYQYRGVRLSDDAAVMVQAEQAPDGAFVAHNDGVTYTVSPDEIVVTSGGATIRREAMVEFHATAT
jgi:hypothetical protein